MIVWIECNCFSCDRANSTGSGHNSGCVIQSWQALVSLNKFSKQQNS